MRRRRGKFSQHGLLGGESPKMTGCGKFRANSGMRAVAHHVCLALLVLCGSSRGVLAETCGATERWFVKVGTDAKGGDVDTAHPEHKSVAELNALPSLRDQVPKGNNKLRLPEECRVYTVQGYLALFKNESDSDYHLVITDPSLRYSPGGSGTEGQETGTSFIAEIPDPNCTAGTQGDPAAHSAFESALRATREKFEAEFPGGKGADSRVNLPVTVTGVAFYDRQHLQVGRAVNGIELHPLLDIQFGGTAPNPPPQPSPTSLWANADFEQGAAGWAGTVDDIGEYIHQPAHSGRQVCWLGGTGTEDTETLRRSVTIPATAQTARLDLWIEILTEETTHDTPYDLCSIEVRGSNGQLLKKLSTLSNLNVTAGFLHQSFDLSAYKGQAVQIVFREREDGAKATSFILDDVTVVTQ